MDTGLRDRVVLITGASGGIGSATAEAFGREGARVALTYASDGEAARATAERVEAAGGQTLVAPMRLQDDASIEAAVAQVVERWGGIDSLVANAVQWPTTRAQDGRTEGLPLDDWRDGLRANLEGTLATVHAALGAMRGRDRPRIVLVSSGVGEEGLPGPHPYGVSKGALYGLMRQLAWDVGRDGILVNVIGTGFTVTERNREMFSDELRKGVAARTPSRQLSTPADVAPLIVFLASPANVNVSGELIREGSSTGRSGHVFDV